MGLRFWCARCGRSYEVTQSLVGRRVRCRACGHVQPIREPLEPAVTPVPASEAAPILSLDAPALDVPAPSTYTLAPPTETTPAPAAPPLASTAGPPGPRDRPSSSWR